MVSESLDGATLGVGIVGTGFGVTAMAPAFAAVPGVAVRAVCSGRLERAEAAANRIGAGFATDSAAELVARDDIDLVCVTAPPHLHCEVVLAALDAGKHVLCEKPFGLDPGEALAMLERATTAGRLHFVDFENRTFPARRAIGAMIDDGTLGEVRAMQLTAMVRGERFPVMNRHGWWHRRDQGGGWLGAMGSHCFDAVRTWFGEVREVAAWLESRRTDLPEEGSSVALPVTADDGFVAQLLTDSGTRCTVNTVSTVGAEVGHRIEVYGSAGTLVLVGDHQLLLARPGEELRPVELPVVEPLADGEQHGHPSRGPLGEWARLIVEAIATGSQIEPNFVDGLRCQEILSALRRSDDAGGQRVAVHRHAVPVDR